MDAGRLFSFGGRINRQTYWIIFIALLVVEAILAYLLRSDNNLLIVLASIVSIFLFVASLATQVKRWHDRNKSGWWALISLVPVIGAIWVLVELGFLAGTPGENAYGLPSGGSPFAV